MRIEITFNIGTSKFFEVTCKPCGIKNFFNIIFEGGTIFIECKNCFCRQYITN